MQARPIELWGGPECSLCHVGDGWRDQCAETGHRDRFDDLDRIAATGIRTLRYPILWETAATDRAGVYDFAWSDRQLGRLRDLGIDVIGGLLHHGSGPAHTHLLDPGFADEFAGFARAAAERYPWIRQWSPINEPLTTARMSGLYGLWHPHASDFSAFARILVNQCLGVARAMSAIRTVIPGAALVQTEDIACTYATAPLARQAAYDNRRRWLSLDLLFGRVTRGHYFHARLLRSGIAAGALDELADGAGRPDVIGADYYLTSERFLDHRGHLYPSIPLGGNGHQNYIDVEAIRVREVGHRVGLEPRIAEVWDRYRTPIALTEVFLGCTEDEQLRWMDQCWHGAHRLRDRGIDVRAMTLWCLFGSVDWSSLLTRRDGHYEPGLFDIRSDPPRATMLVEAARAYALGEAFDHPWLDRPGWWQREDRFLDAPRAMTG